MTVKRPLIFVTNDDGIFSKGILSLIEAVKPFGELLVIAPDKPQSGMGHAITVNNILRLYPYMLFEGVNAFTCSGTPVDCVKLGMYELKGRKPDLVVSGINHGENTSTNVLYSGTMSAAVEGAIEGVPSVGFSLADLLPADTCLNVNIPKIPANEIKGIKICRAARAFWEDSFDKRLDQYGNPYYWLTGQFKNSDKGEDTDLWAMENGYASIVPVQFDMTAYHAVSELKRLALHLSAYCLSLLPSSPQQSP